MSGRGGEGKRQRREGKKKKAIWSISNCILLPQRTPPVSAHVRSSSLSPSAFFSIRQALFLNLAGPVRTTFEKEDEEVELGIISPCHIFNLPNTYTCTDTHTAAATHFSLVSPLSFSLLKLLLFLVIPCDTLDELERTLVGRFNLIFRCQA